MTDCVSELSFMASKDLQLLQKVLEKDAGYIINESGQVVAYLTAEIHSNCFEMEFSAYPRDKHKCEFFIYSPIYVKVRANVQHKRKYSTDYTFSRMPCPFTQQCTKIGL